MPTRTPSHRPAPVDTPSWRQVIATVLLTLTVPLTLWSLTNPLPGTAVLAAGWFAARGLHRLDAFAGCLRVCDAVAVDLGAAGRLTVSHHAAPDACP